MMDQKELSFLKNQFVTSHSKHSLDLDSLECSQTLDQLSPEDNIDEEQEHFEHLSNYCTCKCTCGGRKHGADHDPLEKKKQKRRQYKRRLKERQKVERDQAIMELKEVIRDIYDLKVDFRTRRVDIQKCFTFKISKDKFYDFINLAIRQHVDNIRREIKTCLKQLEERQEEEDCSGRTKSIRRMFEQFNRIRKASPEIEKIINFYIRKSCEGQSLPIQKNLDKMTFRFILKNDLRKIDYFGVVCSMIFQQKQLYKQQKQILKTLLELFDEQELEQYEEDDDSDYDDCESSEYDEEESQESIEKSKKVKGRAKRRKRNEELDSSFEAILKRTNDFVVKEQERFFCRVTEEFLERMKLKMQSIKNNT